ncbi:TrmH family RNA methyltransferase [Candidatus Parcubacteria bacterium]|nr:MAG: TrmH family RNA methyltransferase [Candidatus Parcubacteria bacterium]
MTTNKKFYIIAHNIRSLYNIGTMFRTADALGVDQLFLTGYSGQPPRKEISKVALGADESVPWQHYKSLTYLVDKLKNQGVKIVILEKSKDSVDYRKFKPSFPLALIVGNEVRGVSADTLKKADKVIELPMAGIKESLNVGVALGAAGYYLNSFRD